MLKKRSVLLKKYIKINFIMIFLPIMFISIIYCSSIQNNYKENYLNTLVYSVDERVEKIESVMEAISSVATLISLDKELTPYRMSNFAYYGVTAREKLNYYKREAGCFQELMICLNDSEKLYTSEGIVDISVFIERKYQLSEELSKESFLQLIRSKERFGCTKEGQYVTLKDSEYSIVTYPLGEGRGNNYGTVIGICENDWGGIVKERFVQRDDKLTILCTDSMEILYTQMPDKMMGMLQEENELTEQLSQLLRHFESETENYEFTLLGMNFIGKIARLDVNGWYFIDMVEESVVNGNFWMMQLPMLIVIFLSMLFLIIFLSAVLAMYNYLPIQKLYHLFDSKEKKKEKIRENDELLLLNEFIRNLLEDQNRMEEQLSNQENESRVLLIRRLLSGSLDMGSAETKELLENRGIHLDKKYLAVMVIKPYHKWYLELEVISQQIERKFEGIYLAKNIYKGYDGFLVCKENEEDIDEFAEWLNEQVEERTARIGIGNIYGAAESLKYSLIEAIIAAESGKERMSRFVDITVQRDREFYCKPLQSEIKLKQMLDQGNAERLDDVLDELHRELFRTWKSNSDVVMHFVMNRIFVTLFENAISLNEKDIEKYLYYTNLDEFLENIREFFCEELNRRLEQNDAIADLRIKAIIDFVDENYSNSEISLAMVAEKFDMTGTYFSSIFKKAIGKNFINYISDKRLELAAKLLTDTDDTIAEIVEKVGYSDTASFTRKFTKHFMVPPGKYRMQMKEKDR